MIYSYSTK